MSTQTITEFLEARIAEDEDHIRLLAETDRRPVLSLSATVNHPQRLLAECAAKRAIIEDWEDPSGPGVWEGYDAGSAIATDQAVRALAAVYADHEDYDSGWAL